MGFWGATEELPLGLSLERCSLPKGALLQKMSISFAALNRLLAKVFGVRALNRWIPLNRCNYTHGMLAEDFRTRGQMAFNRVDQFLNVDWLGQK